MASRGEPIDAVLAVTYRCNGRCTMCDIWRAKPGPEVGTDVYGRLPRSLRYVNLSGGEPFLRADLPEIVRTVRRACPRSQIIISSNGLNTCRIVAMMKAARQSAGRVGIAISIDGIGAVHDRIRGVPGAFKRASATVQALKSVGVRGIRIAFTGVGPNLSHLGRVYRLSREWRVGFTCALAHGSDLYFKAPKDRFNLQASVIRGELSAVAEAELRTLSPRRWARAYFLAGLYRYARGEARSLPCYAARDFFFMAPNGDIHPCNVLAAPLGNLAETHFEALWRSPRADEARERVAHCREGCWMICTVRTAIRRHPLRVMAWVLRHQLLPGPVL